MNSIIVMNFFYIVYVEVFIVIVYCSYNPEEHSSNTYEAVAEEDLTEKDIKYLVVLERIFLSAKEMEKAESPPEEKDEMTDETHEKNEELKSEINKQKMLVAYFKASHNHLLRELSIL